MFVFRSYVCISIVRLGECSWLIYRLHSHRLNFQFVHTFDISNFMPNISIFYISFDKIMHKPKCKWIYCFQMQWPFCHWPRNSHAKNNPVKINLSNYTKSPLQRWRWSTAKKKNTQPTTNFWGCVTQWWWWRTRSHSITISKEESRMSFVVLFAFHQSIDNIMCLHYICDTQNTFNARLVGFSDGFFFSFDKWTMNSSF